MKHRDHYDSHYNRTKNSKLLEILIKDNENYRNDNYSEIEKPHPHSSPLIQSKKSKKKPKGNKDRSTNSPKHRINRLDLTPSVSNTHIQNPMSNNLYKANSINVTDYINQDFSLKSKADKYRDEKVTMTTYPMSFSPDNVTCYGCTDLANEKRRLTKLLKAVNENLEKNELKEVINLYRQELKAQWTQLAQVIDALLLYTFTISTFLLLFYLINQAPNANIF